MKKFIALLLVAAAAVAFKAVPGGYKIGDTVADFKLKNVDGKIVSLADYQTAKGYIVVFTCNHCPYAQGYEQRIMELDKTFAAKGYPVIAISPSDPVLDPDDSYENMQKVASNKKYTFPYLIDEGQHISRAFGATATPHVFILQKTSAGNVVQYIGAIDDDTEGVNANRTKYVEKAVNTLLAAGKPEITNTKAVGCRIKWAKAE